MAREKEGNVRKRKGMCSQEAGKKSTLKGENGGHGNRQKGESFIHRSGDPSSTSRKEESLLTCVSDRECNYLTPR